MRTVTVRELKSNPSEALRDAREGPVLVLNRGVPEAVIVTVAGDAAGIGLADRVGEAAEAMRGLADRGEHGPFGPWTGPRGRRGAPRSRRAALPMMGSPRTRWPRSWPR